MSSELAPYPKAEVEYQTIAQNPDLFWEKLLMFHEYLGTKFKVPTIGGKSVDLHHLFVEVTSKGGIEKAIRDKRWREVTAAFKFPSSLTSGSFALRKCYLSLLYHFEQVYYFRREEPPSSVVDPRSPSENTNGSAAPQAFEDATAVDQHSEGLDLEEGSFVTGTVDAKFDNGYIITVDLGSEKLNGVLYHMPMPTTMSQALVPVSCTRGRKRRRKSSIEDPFRPKRNRSGYTFFFGEQYPRIEPSYHGQDKKSITKEIAAMWNRLSAAEKQVYKDIGMRDKERYKAELSEYKSSHHPEVAPVMEEFDDDDDDENYETIKGIEIGKLMDMNNSQIDGSTTTVGQSIGALEDPQKNAYGKSSRPKKSVVHQEMDAIILPDGTKKWKCKWCGSLYTFDEKWKSTSNVKKHLEVCLQRKFNLDLIVE